MAVRPPTHADPMGAAHFPAGKGAPVEVVRDNEPKEQVEDRERRDAARTGAPGTSPADAVSHVQLY